MPGGVLSLARALSFEFNSQFESKVTMVTNYYTDLNEELNITSLNLNVSTRILKSPLRKLVLSLLRINKMMPLIKRERPDVIVCLDPSSLFVSIVCKFALWKKQMKIVGTCYTPIELLTMSDRFILRFFSKKADLFVFPTHEVESNLKMISCKLKKVISNPLSLDSLYCSTNRKFEVRQFDVIFFGRLSKEKRPELLVELASLNPKLKFAIYGEGLLYNGLEEQISRRELINVMLVGRGLPWRDLSSSRILLFPSLNETFGMTVIEGWLHGLKILTSQSASGPSMLVEKFGNGSVVKISGNVMDWNLEMLKLLKVSQEEKEFGDTHFVRQILDTFHPYSISKSWFQALQDLY
jgi:glycosyltransferase involved in cell wall biosynthesis